MVVEKENDNVVITLKSHEAMILAHIFGSIKFYELRDSVISDGYFNRELSFMRSLIDNLFIKLNDKMEE